MIRRDCDGCARCVACERTWCRDDETSPGEADGICRDCWELENPDEREDIQTPASEDTAAPAVAEGIPQSSAPRSPGFVLDMSDEVYQSDPVEGGSLSSTFARLLTKHVPAKAEAIHRNRKPTTSMNLGKAAHLRALGAGPELIVWQHDGRTKAGKAERAERFDDIATERAVAVSELEAEQVEGMVRALRADPEVASLITSGQPEVSAFWQEPDGTWCRARYDVLGPVAYDYKTTDDASRFGFEKAMADYGYHQQADFYLRGLYALEHEAWKQPLRFICQEKQEPYLVQVHSCDDLAMEVARVLNDQAIDTYAKSKANGEWLGYPTLHADPTGLPARYFYRYMDLIPGHLNPHADPGMSM